MKFNFNKTDAAVLGTGLLIWALTKVKDVFEQKQMDEYIDARIDAKLEAKED